MDSMNDICKNASAVPPWRDGDLLAVGREREATTQNPIEVVDNLTSFSKILTNTELPQHTNSPASISVDKFFHSTAAVNTDTDDGASVITTSNHVTFADQTLTSIPVTSATGTVHMNILYTI